jgi:ABC-2 type transport system permease protein
MTEQVGLIARREITTRLQQKGYRIGLAVTLLIAIVAVVLPSFFSGGSDKKSYDIAVAPATAPLGRAVAASGTAAGVRVHVHRAGAAEARDKVDAGTWDAALLPGPALVAQHSDDAVVSFVEDALQRAGVVQRLRAAGLSDAQITRALAARPLSVQATKSGADTQRQTLAVITVIVLFSQLITFCTWVATGVVEEKSSRVVELLLSSVRPVQLLAGKLLGIGGLAAAQIALLAGAALVAARAAGTLTLPPSNLLTVLISYVAFLLGFAFFAALSAALASTVSRQEEVSGVLTPVSMLLIVCYLVSFTNTGNSASTFGRVISIVPPVSSIAMPARIARGDASAFDVVLAVVLLLVAAVAALLLAARIYQVSVLHTGTRLKLRQAWRGEAVGAGAGRRSGYSAVTPPET